MGKVNFSRVILGGVVAGIVINISEFVLNGVVMKTQMEEWMKALGKPVPMSGSAMAVWIVWAFAAGIVLVWLYAAIRPRYGAGPGTAARAGLAMWFFASLLAMVAMQNMGLFPLSPVVLVWTLVEAVVAAIAGAWVYREAGA